LLREAAAVTEPQKAQAALRQAEKLLEEIQGLELGTVKATSSGIRFTTGASRSKASSDEMEFSSARRGVVYLFPHLGR
jgi:hypothetical protein